MECHDFFDFFEKRTAHRVQDKRKCSECGRLCKHAMKCGRCYKGHCARLDTGR